jgi:maltose-binding protein MalE
MPRVGGTGGGGISLLTGNVFQLYLYAKIKPEMWDAVVPMGPKYSKGTLDVIAAQIIKTVAGLINSKPIRAELNDFGTKLFSSGLSAMSYDGDDWPCGNGLIPKPHFITTGLLDAVNPQPQPPTSNYYGSILSLVAETISNKEIAAGLAKLSARLGTE